MKKYSIILALVFSTLLIGQAHAQKGPRRGQGQGMGNRPAKEKVDAMKIGFITNFLDLTSEEAKNFWPVYNKYQDEIELLRRSRRDNILNEQTNLDSMPDGELEKLVDSEIIFHQNELDIQKKYHPQFKHVLPMKKVAKLYRAEEEFKRKLLEMIREKRQERKQQMREN